MVKPILACKNPYEVSELFKKAGWKIEFSQPVESGDSLVGVSLFENTILLGITEGYVKEEDLKHVGCGVEIYITVPREDIQEIYNNHLSLHPTALEMQPWGVQAFEVVIGGYKFMIATS